MFIISNIDNILNELKKIIPKENFKKEPESSADELKQYEENYNLSTIDFINKNKDVSHIPTEIQDNWINTLENYLIFGGKIEGIDYEG